MDRSPALEGKDGGRGSGSWPRTPRFAVGDEVEVLFTGSGFRGARFEATVTARFPDSGRYEVVYSELIVRRDGPPLREVVGVSELRPRPPPPQPGREFELFDLVEAYNNDGWWPGVVSDIRPNQAEAEPSETIRRVAPAVPRGTGALGLVRAAQAGVRVRKLDRRTGSGEQISLPALLFYRIQTSF